MATKKTSATQVRLIMNNVANDMSVNKAAKKFNISPAAIWSMVNGKTHTQVTGLDGKSNNTGVSYIRENKELFSLENTKSMESPIDPKMDENPSIVPTAKPSTTPMSDVVGIVSVDLSDNINAIRSEAATAISKLDGRKLSLEAELKQIKTLRDYWEKFSTM